jgi:multidrug efflux pump subunit AcrA (membrane-fusion protein)
MLGPQTKYADEKEVEVAEAKFEEFGEYVDVEGIVQPILNIKVNSREGGTIKQIVAREGEILDEGDTIIVIDNPELLRNIEEERLAWEKQQTNHRLQNFQMEQKSLTLRQQVLQAEYELSRLNKSHELDKEEARMGIKSKAQLQASEEEYSFNVQKTRLMLESLKHDSAVNIIQRSLLDNELESGRKKFQRATERTTDLVVRSPAKGQLSFVAATLGQRIATGESIAEINILDDYKVKASLSEYYIDRITTGLPASISYQGWKFPMRISRVVPEVKERTFTVELVFTEEKPENARVGKSYRIQIELGKPEKALVIPRGDFYSYSGGRYVYKLNEAGTTAVRTPITIGRQNPKQFEVVEGLQAGDRIILSDYASFGEAERIKFR